jgi:hypothetical protein
MCAPGLRLTAFLIGVSVVAERRLVGPGTQKARTACGRGPPRATSCDGSTLSPRCGRPLRPKLSNHAFGGSL